MQPLHCIRNNPIIVICGSIAALGVWIAFDLLPAQPQATIADLEGGPPSPVMVNLEAPIGNGSQQSHSVEMRLDMLPYLKTGMTRIEVEKLIGPPEANYLQPVSESKGTLTYTTEYELSDPQSLANLGPPESASTVHPIRLQPARLAQRPVSPKSHVTLEYDASKPGHPLIEIRYPDPLF